MIRVSPVRLIGEDNEQIGVVELKRAKELAYEAGLDLVEISPEARPPVVRIMDYGKFKYEQSKKEHRARAGAKKTELKEVRLGRSLKIDEHDVQLRLKQARGFLMEGHKVQFVQPFKGREMQYRNQALERFRELVTALADIAKVEQPPKLNMKRMMMIVAPDRAKVQALKRDKSHATVKHDGHASDAPASTELVAHVDDAQETAHEGDVQ